MEKEYQINIKSKDIIEYLSKLQSTVIVIFSFSFLHEKLDSDIPTITPKSIALTHCHVNENKNGIFGKINDEGLRILREAIASFKNRNVSTLYLFNYNQFN
jgi:hypothetical protein